MSFSSNVACASPSFVENRKGKWRENDHVKTGFEARPKKKGKKIKKYKLSLMIVALKLTLSLRTMPFKSLKLAIGLQLQKFVPKTTQRIRINVVQAFVGSFSRN